MKPNDEGLNLKKNKKYIYQITIKRMLTQLDIKNK